MKNYQKGAWIEFDDGVCPNCRGFSVGVWKIKLYVRLDKYRRDYKGNPIISRLLRVKYVSAERNVE